jgi:hypothetical protein
MQQRSIVAIATMSQVNEENARRGELVRKAWNQKRELLKAGVEASKQCPAWLTYRRIARIGSTALSIYCTAAPVKACFARIWPYEPFESDLLTYMSIRI